MEYTKENVVKIVEDFKDLIVAIEMERRIRYDAVHEGIFDIFVSWNILQSAVCALKFVN